MNALAALAPYFGAVGLAAAVVRWRRCAPHATWTRWLHGVHAFVGGGLVLFDPLFRVAFDQRALAAAVYWILLVLMAATVSLVTVVVWTGFRAAGRRPDTEVVDMAVAGVSVATLLPPAFCWVIRWAYRV